MNKLTVIPILLLAITVSLTTLVGNIYAEELQTLQLEIKYTNGDRIDAYQTNYKIYQDDKKTPFLEKTLERNPETIELPKNHRYKVEVYVNGMYSEVGYSTLQNKSQKLDISIPLPGGLKFKVFFNDGETPIRDAKLIIKSNNGEIQRIGNTNDKGETMRYWLQSTSIPQDHYVAEVYFGDFMLTSVSNIKLQQGISQDQKIIVPIPEIVEELITFRLFDTNSNKLMKKDGNFSILLVDQNNLKTIGHMTGPKGEIYFSSLPSGIYSASVLNGGIKDPLWPETSVLISGKQNNFDLFQTNPIQPEIPEIIEPTKETTPLISNITETDSFFEPVVYKEAEKNFSLSCNCVAFRLDGLQDYWLNNVQWDLIDYFMDRELPLTTGVIIDSFGEDSFLYEKTKKGINSGILEIANHGLDSTPFTIYDKTKQFELLKESSEKINEKLNVQTTVFIPPENRFNEDTKEVLKEIGFTHISASEFSDEGPYPLKDQPLFRFPALATTGEYVPSQNRILGISYEETFSDISKSIDAHGFAVVTIHPQEFSIFRGGEYSNEVNPQQIQELSLLIQKIQDNDIKVVHLGKIDQKIMVIYPDPPQNLSGDFIVPSWIKNNAGWWRDGYIDDDSFILSIQFLINENILSVPTSTQETEISEIPSWIKENAGWWAEGKISDNDFIYGVDYLVKHGIIIIEV
ncbi:MAG: polysaccharide deacetylase family protein [Nitrosopumilaceae archaeon]|nr:polysaccharide deacetylase family protein [Nitrosopumilaceae archaeon]